MGCQRKICKQIVEQEANYVISLKGNQSGLHEDVKLFVQEQQANNWEDCDYDFHEDTYSGHGRIEVRKCWVTDDIDWLRSRHSWPGLESIGIVEATRSLKGKTSVETRLYISSLPANGKNMLQAARAHWSVENSLHWTLDVTFADDANQTKNKHAANNLHIVKKMALNLLKKMPNDRSIKTKRKSAGWNKNYMLKVLNAANR